MFACTCYFTRYSLIDKANTHSLELSCSYFCRIWCCPCPSSHCFWEGCRCTILWSCSWKCCHCPSSFCSWQGRHCRFPILWSCSWKSDQIVILHLFAKLIHYIFQSWLVAIFVDPGVAAWDPGVPECDVAAQSSGSCSWKQCHCPKFGCSWCHYTIL